MSDSENSRIRAEIWGDYVGWGSRKDTEDGFLVSQLAAHASEVVLDVALGDGVDTIDLVRAGFFVLCNEVNADFRERATLNAQKLGIDLNPTGYQWSELRGGYSAASVDAIICMGHSIGCVLQEGARRLSLAAFWEILKPQGVLIIDERNFLGMKGSVQMGELYPCGNHVYTGSGKVEIMFTKFDETSVCINYVHKEKDKRASYEVYPFKKGELVSALLDSGFTRSSIQVYSDYKPGYRDSANYYQYVCVKRSDGRTL